MNPRFIILYSLLAAAAVAVLMLCQPRPAEPPPAETSPRMERLSAIVPAAGPAKRSPAEAAKIAEIVALEAKISRLQAKLGSLEASADRDELERVPVDLESFCKHFGFVMKTFQSLKPNGALVATLELSEAESQAFELTADNFLRRLQALDRKSMQLIVSDEAVIKLKIPYRNEARTALFAELDSELHELLGPGRARVGAETFYRNELIGSASCERNFEVMPTSEGKYTISAQIVPTTAVFPGTDIPYDGTPGVEPELFTTRSIKSSVTVDASSAEKMFGGLIDFDRWQARTEN